MSKKSQQDFSRQHFFLYYFKKFIDFLDNTSAWLKIHYATWEFILTNQEMQEIGETESDLSNYKQAVVTILDEYISWWKLPFSWIHHHDMRARVLKTAILSSELDSARSIRLLLLRQTNLINPENYVIISDENEDEDVLEHSDFKYEFIDPVNDLKVKKEYEFISTDNTIVDNKWNLPQGVIHHHTPEESSGFFKILKRCYEIDPDALVDSSLSCK